MFPTLIFTLLTAYLLLVAGRFYFAKEAIGSYKAFKRILIYLPFSQTFKKFSKLSEKERKLFSMSDILGLSIGLSFALGSLNLYYNFEEYHLLEVIIHFLIFIGVTLGLLYLANFDLINFAIPELETKRILIATILINFTVGIINLVTLKHENEKLLVNIKLGTIENLLGMALLFAIFYCFVKFSNEKAMGSGDIDINAIIGLMLGFKLALIYLLVTFITAGIFSLLLVSIQRKYKGVMVPLVPFLVFGFVVTLGFGENIYNFLFRV